MIRVQYFGIETMYFLMEIAWLLCILPLTSSARILFMHPHISKSHANFNDAITKSLLEAGHQVTAFTAFPENIQHPNYTKVDTWRPDLSEKTNFVPFSVLFEIRNNLNLMDFMTIESEKDCVRVIHFEEMRRITKSKEKLFDLLIVDIMAYSYECFLPIADVLNIPVIGTIPMRSWRSIEWVVGNLYNPAVTPFDISFQSHKMTFTQRLKNSWDCVVDIWFYNQVVSPKVDKFYRDYFPTVTSRRKPSLLFVNGHSALNPRPLIPTVVNLGGIHVSVEKPLPDNLQTFIDTAEHGVILFSVGSVVQSHKMPAEILSVFRQVFAKLPQRVIWKSEADIELVSENILLCKWLPQRDILAHKNVVAFISHAGLSGIYEGLLSAVPMVLIPIFFDQMSNAAILEQLGLVINLDLYTITEETLKNSLDQIINGSEYRERAKEMSILMKDQPLSAEETVVYWVEYVIRHNGTQYLETAASKMPLYQYLLLDVIGLVLIIILTISFGLYYLLNRLCKYFHWTIPSIGMKKQQ